MRCRICNGTGFVYGTPMTVDSRTFYTQVPCGHRRYDDTPEGASAAASHLGRVGGRNGGLERARRLSPERRAEIARRAAKVRWDRNDDDRPIALPISPPS